jgi:hypothetical protein
MEDFNMKIIKKLAKGLIIIFILNVISGIGFLGYLTFTVFGPSLKSADVSVLDFIKSDLTPEQKSKLDNTLKEKGTSFGVKQAEKLHSFLVQLFPPTNFNYSQVKSVSYPYPSPSQVVDMNNQKSQAALKQGLDMLKQMDKNNSAARQEGLKLAQ